MVKRPGFLPQLTFQLHHFLAVTLGQLPALCLFHTRKDQANNRTGLIGLVED